MHIAIAGNIGSGKTTLCTLLAQHYGWEARFECVMENPYLSDFYADIQRWSFNLEVFFLKERFRDALDIAACKRNIVQDRTIWEGVHVFVENNFRMGNMSERDHETFIDLFSQMEEQLPLPDLMVYLKAPINHLVGNIQKRGRQYEQTIQIEYLQGLNTLYEDFIQNKYPGRVLTIDVEGLDYLHNTQDFRHITNKLDPLVGGLFPLNS